MDNLRARAGKIQSDHRIYCVRKQGRAQRMMRVCLKHTGASLNESPTGQIWDNLSIKILNL